MKNISSINQVSIGDIVWKVTAGTVEQVEVLNIHTISTTGTYAPGISVFRDGRGSCYLPESECKRLYSDEYAAKAVALRLLIDYRIDNLNKLRKDLAKAEQSFLDPIMVEIRLLGDSL